MFDWIPVFCTVGQSCGASVRAGVSPQHTELAGGAQGGCLRSSDRVGRGRAAGKALPPWHQTGPAEGVALQSAKAQRLWPGWQHPARLCSSLPWSSCSRARPWVGEKHKWGFSHLPRACCPWEGASSSPLCGPAPLVPCLHLLAGLSSATLPHQHGTATKHGAALDCQPLSDKNQHASAPRTGAEDSLE